MTSVLGQSHRAIVCQDVLVKSASYIVCSLAYTVLIFVSHLIPSVCVCV